MKTHFETKQVNKILNKHDFYVKYRNLLPPQLV